MAGLAWVFLAFNRNATYQIATQDAVSGLITDSPVEFHGVEVGKVTRIELTDPRSVRILLSIRKEAPVTTATVATITARGLATRGFTGYVYVALEDVGTDSRPLAALPGNPFPVIRTAPARSATLDTTISQVNENVRVITELLRSVLDEKTIVSLRKSVDNLRQVSGVLAANNEKLGSIILNTERASNQFKPLLESSNDTVKALQTQVLPEAYKALANIDTLATSLNGVATKLSRDPSILIRGSAAPPGPGETR
jgi:phospholipid/cholesterol/gamma-HCH transport system substrate-binding protein